VFFFQFDSEAKQVDLEPLVHVARESQGADLALLLARETGKAQQQKW
jgi:hypothetical protein